MSLVECVPNPKAVAASADFERWPANGVTANYARTVEGTVIDDGSRDNEQRGPCVRDTDECAGGVKLASQAVGLRFLRLRTGRFHVKIVDLADFAFFGSLFVPMREGMMLRPVGGHDR